MASDVADPGVTGTGKISGVLSGNVACGVRTGVVSGVAGTRIVLGLVSGDVSCGV